MDMHQVPVPAGDSVTVLTYMQWFGCAQVMLGSVLTLAVACGDASAIKMVAKYQKWGFGVMIASNLYICFGGVAASAWGAGFSQLDAIVCFFFLISSPLSNSDTTHACTGYSCLDGYCISVLCKSLYDEQGTSEDG